MKSPRAILRILSVSAAIALSSASLAAQTPTQTANPWAAFFGCWAPTEGQRGLAVTCVLPSDASPLESEQMDFIGGNLVRTVSLRADGVRRDIDAAGCKGWESAAFSVDGSRVYTRGSATCAQGGEQSTSGLLSITPNGEFLRVGVIRVGEQRNVTTQRFDLVSWIEVPTPLKARVASLTTMASGARTRISNHLSLVAIEDALQSVDAFAVEAWMAGTGNAELSFRVTRRELERLVAVNAPTRIIDLSVALSNPDRFATPVARVAARTWDTPRPPSVFGSDWRMDAFCDQMQLGMLSWRGSFPLLVSPGMGLSYYGWMNDCAGRGFYSRWAFGPYSYGGTWFGGPFQGVPGPVTITPRTPSSPGTVRKGSGYSNDGASTSPGGTARPRSGGDSGPSRVQATNANSSSSNGESSSGGARSAGSNGTGRTAQPRNP